MPFRRPRHSTLVLCSLLACSLVVFARSAPAIEFFDGRVQIHGYGEMQMRALSNAYHPDTWYWSQWANILDIEVEADIAPKGFGPFDSISSYSRILVRYDCIWSKMCGLDKSADYFGNRAYRGPEKNTDGKTSGFTGVVPDIDMPSEKTSPNHYLLPFTDVPPLDLITTLGGTNLDNTFKPLLDSQFAIRNFGGTLGPGILPMGPWLPKNTIHPSGSLQSVHNFTTPLPFRPTVPDAAPAGDPGAAHGLYVPSTALRQEMGKFDSFDQNFRQAQLEWDHGASQDEHELREAYIDAETLDGRLWMRLGKQNIVWGKTELFRTTDQFNPQDLALATLSSLEDSRIPLWAARFVYSLYDVGPLEDVRAEFAANLDDFEPSDLGRCGEPYTIFLVCGKSVGLFAHGALGVGVAGEKKPPAPWNNIEGLELGGRLEWRWDRFSFALTDFWGYNDFPTINNFNVYSRAVDPNTGQPVDRNGHVINPSDPNLAQNVLKNETINRQFFDVFCSGTVGIAGNILTIPGLDLSNECALTILNSQAVALPPSGTIAGLLGVGLAGTPAGFPTPQNPLGLSAGTLLTVILTLINPGGPIPPFTVQSLNLGGSETFGGLSTTLTVQQQALLGCGPFYGTNCDVSGIDLANAEASVLLQRFPQFEPGGPVATRYVHGHLITLPGARGPFLADGSPDPLYDPRIDGCVAPAFSGRAPAGFCNVAGVTNLLALGYKNELAVVSQNLLTLLSVLGSALPTDKDCSVTTPITCDLVRGIFGAAGTQRPDLRAGGNGRFGRRDFFWQGGSEIELFYHKRNILGLSADFAEDRTKTNWGVEFTWDSGEPYANNHTASGHSINDTLNLTVSVDRPTFINFLNANRTFLFNTQWFFRYIADYQRGGIYALNGPMAVLGTFTIITGYFQDRLNPSLTLVHDVRSNSGAVLFQTAYRFSDAFSATIGVSNFYGHPQRQQIPYIQPVIGNNGGSFETRTAYDGVSPLAQSDEAFLMLRYTF
ncbi:MAG TPA: DUF1302 family protein [Myxococcota bacterium]|jgi:hypothetical protein|nr:DUF1302 family protein [Myxococcota bacterium]